MKYTEHPVDDNGWTEWISPLHGQGKKNYRVKCCDCGLVHELQFRISRDARGRATVIYRGRRNNRATAAGRR